MKPVAIVYHARTGNTRAAGTAIRLATCSAKLDEFGKAVAVGTELSLPSAMLE